MSFGIDISYAQKGLDWDEIAENCDFVMIKASQGNYLVGSGAYTNDRKPFVDSMMKSHVTECIKRGIPFGFYHFLIAETVAEAEEEALFFCETIAPYASQSKLPMYQAVDLEYNPIEEKYRENPDELNSRVRVFCQTVQQYGNARNQGSYFLPMVYTNPDYLRNRGLVVPSEASLWLAAWVNTSGSGYRSGYFAENEGVRAEEIESLFSERYSPTYGCTFWQYGYEVHGMTTSYGGYIDGIYTASDVFSRGSKIATRGTRYYQSSDLLVNGEQLDGDSRAYITVEGTYFAEKEGLDEIYEVISAYDESVKRFAVSDDTSGTVFRLIIDVELLEETTASATGSTEIATGEKVSEGDSTNCRFFIDGEDETESIEPYLCSLEFTDENGGVSDTLSFTLYDKDGIWQDESGLGVFLQENLPVGVILTERIDGKERLLNMGTFYPASVHCDSVQGTIAVKCVSMRQNSYLKTAITKTWYNVGIAEIAKQICQKAGVRFFDSRRSGTEVQFATLIQREQSPAAFLAEIAEVLGVVVKIANGGIVLQDLESVQYDTATIEKADCQYYRFTAKCDEAQYSSVSVGHTGIAGMYHGSAISEVAGKAKQYDINVGCVAIGGNDFARIAAGNFLDSLNHNAVSGEITVVGNPQYVCGCGIRLTDFGYFDGEYVIQTARHRLDKRGYKTTLGVWKRS